MALAGLGMVSAAGRLPGAAPSDRSRVAEDAAAAATNAREPEARAGATTGAKPLIPIAWRSNLDAAKREAAERGWCILVYFRADWCAPCRLMGKGTFTLPAVAQFINRHFVPVRIDDSNGRGEVTKAYDIRVYPSVLFLDPGGEPVHLVLGPRVPEVFYRTLQQVKTLPALMERQHAHPDSLEANFALGNTLGKLNQLKKAAPYLEKAAALDPKNDRGRRSQARLILAVVPLEEGKSAEALANLEAWLREFGNAPEAPVAVWYQGTILYQDGRLNEARRYFEQIIEQFPKHTKAYEADKAIEHIDARLRGKAAGKTDTKPPAKEPAPAQSPPEPKG